MQDNQSNKQSFAIPVAIVLAGLLIGGAVYMSGKGGIKAGGIANPLAQAARDITIRPISAADHILGSANAQIAIVEYSDTECPFCKNFHTTLQTIMSTYGTSGKVSWVYRHFPISQLHSKAPHEAQATECAADQGKFWPYIDAVYSTTQSNNSLDSAQLPVIAKSVGLDVDAFNACLSSDKHVADITASVAEAQNAGANGTPSSFLVLATPMSQKTANDVTLLYASLKLPDGSLPVTINKARTIVGISGALPIDYIKATVDTILGTKVN
ncbi:MAG: thioredoxin domain-containing protein [Candidatus Paceibacterota bacterium]|jgi:protein-disulfide isomerase